MQIQLDHISKNLKNSLICTFMIAISFLLLSCNEQEFNIIDTNTEVTKISVYQYDSLNFENDKYSKLSLFESYPNLQLAIKLSNPEINVTSFEFISPNKDFSWDIKPKLIDIDSQQYFGASNINLVSYYFEEGDYLLKLASDDGRQIVSTINVKNPFNDINTIKIYLKEDSLIFSSKELSSDLNFVSTLVPLEIGNLIVNYYDKNKNLINTKKYDNNFNYQNYQFQISIDNFDNVYYVELIYQDIDSVRNYLKIDLSSSHSFF